jgi:hypothetical protein
MFGLLDVIDNGWVLQPSLRTCPLSRKESEGTRERRTFWLEQA